MIINEELLKDTKIIKYTFSNGTSSYNIMRGTFERSMCYNCEVEKLCWNFEADCRGDSITLCAECLDIISENLKKFSIERGI